ncbi:tryglysin family RiPP peptide [Streptococcus raffinosi]
MYQIKEERPISPKKEFNAPKTTKVNSWGKH